MIRLQGRSMKILHISSMYPSATDPINGIFVRQLVTNLTIYGTNQYRVVVPRKIYRRDHSVAMNLTSWIRHNWDGGENVDYLWYLPAKAFGLKRGYDALLAEWFIKSRLVKSLTFGKIDLIHAHSAVPDGYLAMQIHRSMGIPYVMHAHGGEITSIDHFDHKYKRLVKEVYNSAKAIICNSKRTRRVLSNLIQRTEIPVAVLAFGIDIAAKAERRYESDAASINIVSVARLVKDKRVDLLIEAVSRSRFLQKINLFIIGDGEEKEYLLNLARSLGVDGHVHFLGSMDNDAVRSSLSNYHFFVLPAVNEGFGVAYLEALAAGLPSVGIKGEGCEDIAQKGDCMLLAEPNSVHDLTSKIDFLVGSPEQMRRMSNEALKVIKEHYSWPEVVKEYEEFYSAVFNA